MRLRHVLALLAFLWLVALGIEIGARLEWQARAVDRQAAAPNRLAAAQEADTELTRRYYHALENAEGER